MRLATGDALYRRVFDFWLKVFAVSAGPASSAGPTEVVTGRIVILGLDDAAPSP